MVSARVLNPVMLSKISSSPAVGRTLPCQLNRVKRDLFGSSKTSEGSTNKTPFNAALERYQEMATQKWGFDFRAGCPLTETSAFSWERVSSQESTYAPEMYTLTRAAHVRRVESTPSDMDTLLNERSERENIGSTLVNSSLESNTDNEFCYDSQDETPLTVRLAAASSIVLRKRQPKITEFMKERKRLAQAPKKLSPAKRLRSTSPSASTSSSAGFGLTHLGAMLKRPRHN